MVNEEDHNGEVLDSTINTLDMTEAELTGNIKRSILLTVRQLIGVRYHKENVVYTDVKKEYIKAEGGYVSFIATPLLLICLVFRILLTDSFG